jgi:opacity protein-like surface antigen
MYSSLKKTSVYLAMGIIGLSTAYASSWDEDNTPPAGSVVTADGGPAPHGGFYLGLEGGGTLLNDQDYGYGVTLQSNPGYNGGITFGYDYKWLRLEEELNAANNGADKLKLPGSPDISIDGRTTSYSAMTNAILNIRGDTGFGVFAGVGIGGSAIDYNYQGGGLLGDNATWKGAFTAQALGGISYSFSPKVELDLEYRYVDAFVSDKNIPDYQTNNLDLGLKFFLT